MRKGSRVGEPCVYDSWPSCGRCMLKSLPSTTESWNLRQRVSSSQNKALPPPGVHQSLLLVLLTSREILKYWIATTCFTSYMNIVITTHTLLTLEDSCSKALCSGWLLTSSHYALDLGGCWGNWGGCHYAVGHYLPSFTANDGLKVSWKI